MSLDGKVVDLAEPIKADAKIGILTRDDPEALELIRHDAAHLLAEAVQELFPGTQVTIGPVIENGFYYDFARDGRSRRRTWPRSKRKMREIVDAGRAVHARGVARDEAMKLFSRMGETYKAEIIDAIPAGEDDLALLARATGSTSAAARTCRRPARSARRFKLMKLAGAYWRGDRRNEMLQRIYGTAWASEEELDSLPDLLEEAEKRDHRKLGRELDLFHMQEEAPGLVFWHPKGWALLQAVERYMRRRQQARRLSSR